MAPATEPHANPELPDPNSGCVAAFERAMGDQSGTEFRRFLPPKSALDYFGTLVELVRVDIERRWERGIPRRVEEYLAEYPELMAPPALTAIVFEEYRARVRAGDPVRPADLGREYGVPTDGWPLAAAASDPDMAGPGLLATMLQSVRAVSSEPAWAGQPPGAPRIANPAPVARVADGPAVLPAVGDTFLGFRLLEELGHGAFGRVYLAREDELRGRLVALKVGTRLFLESQALAQLQHTNIVPIYSLHRTKALQAVCMPYFGRTTLAHVLVQVRGQAVFPSTGGALLSTLHPLGASTAPDRPGSASGDRAVPPPGSPSLAGEPGPAAKALLSRLSYADAVVWVGARLAAGLAHAHERGILHRDLKPANVLLTDEGVPMILDFNLAEDTKLRPEAGLAAVGGTLPYMSPEQLAAFDQPDRSVDGRSDVYSLGVVLFELLTGRRPFDDTHRSTLKAVIQRMCEIRAAGAPSPRALNPAVPYGVDAIVARCLAPEPAARYQTARDLQEDLDRHLRHQPLAHVRVPSVRERVRKWAARHPRLSSSSSVAAVALVLVAALAASAGYARERNRMYRAAEVFRKHGQEFRDLQAFLDDRNRSRPNLDDGLVRCRAVLGRYGMQLDGENDGWEREMAVRYLDDSERQALRDDVGEVFYRMARVAYLQAVTAENPAARAAHASRAGEWNTRAERVAGDHFPRALLEQRVDLARLAGDPSAEKAARERAMSTEPAEARDYYLMGYWSYELGRHLEARRLLQKATQMDPENFAAWFVRGNCHQRLAQFELAALCFSSCIALNPGSAPAWLNRGQAFTRLRFYDLACADYDEALRLDPKLTEARLQRAGAKEAQRDLKGAIADLTAALESGTAPTRVFFFRASLKERLGDKTGAAADRTEGLSLTPTDDTSWIARAENRLSTPDAALQDVEQALRLNATNVFAMQLKAHILAERLGRGPEAILVLDRAVDLYPDYVKARAGRGVLLARAGKRTEALRDAEEALLRDTKGPNLYQVACIYALTSKDDPTDRVKAFELLRAALRTGFGLDLVDTDNDLDLIRKDPAYQRVVAEARSLAAARER